jgi:hypothetical protein
MGMIFDETYKPFFENARANGVYDRAFGDVDVQLSAVASRTGKRAEAYKQNAGDRIHSENTKTLARISGRDHGFGSFGTHRSLAFVNKSGTRG